MNRAKVHDLTGPRCGAAGVAYGNILLWFDWYDHKLVQRCYGKFQNQRLILRRSTIEGYDEHARAV